MLGEGEGETEGEGEEGGEVGVGGSFSEILASSVSESISPRFFSSLCFVVVAVVSDAEDGAVAEGNLTFLDPLLASLRGFVAILFFDLTGPDLVPVWLSSSVECELALLFRLVLLGFVLLGFFDFFTTTGFTEI